MIRRNKGFTLIELMMTVAIVAILAAVAIPTYRSYAIRANRSDGKTAVLAMAGALERCYTRFNAYNDALCTVDITDVPSPYNHYMLNATVTASTFLISAAPSGGQAADTKCGTLRINQLNERTVYSATLSADACWGK